MWRVCWGGWQPALKFKWSFPRKVHRAGTNTTFSFRSGTPQWGWWWSMCDCWCGADKCRTMRFWCSSSWTVPCSHLHTPALWRKSRSWIFRNGGCLIWPIMNASSWTFPINARSYATRLRWGIHLSVLGTAFHCWSCSHGPVCSSSCWGSSAWNFNCLWEWVCCDTGVSRPCRCPEHRWSTHPRWRTPYQVPKNPLALSPSLTSPTPRTARNAGPGTLYSPSLICWVDTWDGRFMHFPIRNTCPLSRWKYPSPSQTARKSALSYGICIPQGYAPAW